METAKYLEIQKRLLDWFDANRRELPWRHKYSPYSVWISEVMLQQTQVKTMLPYFERWMRRFPDIRSVAEASEEELLKHWEGIGYYSRVRNIQRTARILVSNFGGSFPEDHEEILRLPGIGLYTAGAIMSFAFNRDYPVVDANIGRVLARLLNVESPIKRNASQAILWRTAREMIPSGDARHFNQALMELGALLCVARNPACSKCPIAAHCKSLELGVVNKRPVLGNRRSVVPIETAVGILVHRGRIFIQKRPASGLLPLLWEFPGGKLKEAETPEDALIREFKEELGVKISRLDRIATVRHSYTSFRVTMHAFFCEFSNGFEEPVLHAAIDSKWVAPHELTNYAFPSANRKLIEML